MYFEFMFHKFFDQYRLIFILFGSSTKIIILLKLIWINLNLKCSTAVLSWFKLICFFSRLKEKPSQCAWRSITSGFHFQHKNSITEECSILSSVFIQFRHFILISSLGITSNLESALKLWMCTTYFTKINTLDSIIWTEEGTFKK